MKLRKLNRSLHRDFGYFFAAMCIIYGLSGLALNHINDWNPSYSLRTKDFKTEVEIKENSFSDEKAVKVLEEVGEEDGFRKYYFPNENTLKIFIKGGSVVVDAEGNGELEVLKRRPIFYQVNFLHYNSARKLWTWFSDAFAVALIFLAISGLFILKGKNGITGRGMWFSLAGLLIPMIFIMLYI